MLSLKLLQAQGFSLSQVQRAMTGASYVDLEEAVVEALGKSEKSEIQLDVESVGVLSATPVAEAKPLIAAAAGRGVSIVIDPTEVEDPEVILAAVTELLNAMQGGTE
jgi:hypothetical protein